MEHSKEYLTSIEALKVDIMRSVIQVEKKMSMRLNNPSSKIQRYFQSTLEKQRVSISLIETSLNIRHHLTILEIVKDTNISRKSVQKICNECCENGWAEYYKHPTNKEDKKLYITGTENLLEGYMVYVEFLIKLFHSTKTTDVLYEHKKLFWSAGNMFDQNLLQYFSK